MMGDGVIDNRMLRQAVDQAGYDGPIEVEIFNRVIWDTDPDQVLRANGRALYRIRLKIKEPGCNPITP